MFAAEFQKSGWADARIDQLRWRLDKVFVKINGKLCYLWRAVDREGEVLETVVARGGTRLRRLASQRIMKKYGRPRSVVTDGLCSYPAAMKEIGNAGRQGRVGADNDQCGVAVTRGGDHSRRVVGSDGDVGGKGSCAPVAWRADDLDIRVAAHACPRQSMLAAPRAGDEHPCRGAAYSHSIVEGGLLEMS